MVVEGLGNGLFISRIFSLGVEGIFGASLVMWLAGLVLGMGFDDRE